MAVAVRQSALAVPTRQELYALGPGDRWTLEERIDQCQDVLREFNDEELRRWVDAGKTQVEIARLVGRSQQRVSQRCQRLGLETSSNRGRPRITTPSNSEGEEVIDAEVVEEVPGERPSEIGGSARSGEGARDISVHFSSATDDWATPQALFDDLHAEFDFELDVCASDENAKCASYFTAEQDGLAQSWTGTCWMNPPYGDVIGRWVAKARASAAEGATVVCLVPARVDTGWFQENCPDGEIRFLRGRVKFGDSPNSAPFPSAVVVFGPTAEAGKVRWGR